jgi:PAS domain S-box-containing protein
MQRLRLTPGRLEGLDLRDIAEKYGLWINAALATLVVVGLLAGGRMVRDGRRLKASARRMSQLLNGLGEGVYGVDLHGCCTFINNAALGMLGYRRDEAIGRQQQELARPANPVGACPLNVDPVQATLADGSARDCEEWFTRKDGTRFPVDIKVAPLVDDGVVTGAVIAFQDIAERRRIAEDLRAEHEFSNAVLNAAGSVIVVMDLDGRVVRLNRAAEEMTGYRREDLGDRPAWDVFIPPEQRERVKAVFADLRAGLCRSWPPGAGARRGLRRQRGLRLGD